LKLDLSRLNTTGEEFLRGSTSHADALTDRIRAALGDIGEVPGRRTVSCRRTARIIADSGCGTCSSGLELATETHGTSIEALQLAARAAVKA